jgi:voltage-gated potassium channel
MMFASGTQVVGVAVFGYVLSNVASLLARLDASREHHMNLLDKVEAYMRHNHLPPKLRSGVRAYFKYMWKTHQGYDDNEVLGILPNKLKAEIALYINREIIEKVPLLKGASPELLEEILMELKPQVCVPSEKVFHAGEPGDAMYFIHSGNVDIATKEGKVLASLKSGAFFGEMALILDSPRSATARATTYTDLFVLYKEAFNKVVSRHPDFAAHVQKIVEERLSSNKKSA